MALPEAPPGKQHPQIATPQGGVLVTTPMGPKSQTAPNSPPPVSDATAAEQKAGADAVQKAQERRRKEQEMGQRIMQQRGGGDQQKLRSQAQPAPNQPPQQGRANPE